MHISAELHLGVDPIFCSASLSLELQSLHLKSLVNSVSAIRLTFFPLCTAPSKLLFDDTVLLHMRKLKYQVQQLNCSINCLSAETPPGSYGYNDGESKEKNPGAGLAAALLCEGNSSTCVRKKGCSTCTSKLILPFENRSHRAISKPFLIFFCRVFDRKKTSMGGVHKQNKKKRQELPLLLFKKVENRIKITKSSFFFQAGKLNICTKVNT